MKYKAYKQFDLLVPHNNYIFYICKGTNDEEGKSDSDFDDGASEFDMRAKRMVKLLDDGGVKKKVTIEF